MNQCACKGCMDEGFWAPALVMTPREHGKVGGKARIELNIVFCSGHRKTISILDVLTDESWEHMAVAFGMQGKSMPDRGSIELDFCHINFGYCN